MIQQCRLLSYAKINLGLYILKKRVDGYHDIATVFQQIDLCDYLYFERTGSQILLTCTDPTIPTNENNLVFRAARLFQTKMEINEGIKVHIEKRIPSGGGLGGGSSNAAAVFLACEKLFDIKLSKNKLHEMALEIGSDVSFFLKGGTALGLGRGEKLEPVDLPMNYHVLLINPDLHISTAWAYSRVIIGLTNGEKIGKFRALLQKPHLDMWQNALNNELESVVFQKYPELQKIKDQLYARGAFYASLSGSGATIYGLFHERKHAEKAQSFFRRLSGMKVFLCRATSGHLHEADPYIQHEEFL